MRHLKVITYARKLFWFLMNLGAPHKPHIKWAIHKPRKFESTNINTAKIEDWLYTQCCLVIFLQFQSIPRDSKNSDCQILKLSIMKISDFHHIYMTYPIVTLCTVLWMYLPYRLPGCIVSMSCVIIIFLKYWVCLWHRFMGLMGST